jgi:signal transduction histidine kinase
LLAIGGGLGLIFPSILFIVAHPDQPFEVFFDLVPTGAMLYAPVFDDAGEVVDFRFERLNPAGQRLLGLPKQPPRTFREYYPTSVPTGIFDKYRAAYLTGQAATYDIPYEGDGIDTFFRLVIQRCGERLVVNFTDLSDLPHSAAEQALRDSRAREQAARAEAEAERQRFYEVLMQLPAQVAVYHGPNHVYQFVNPPYQRKFPHRTFVGRPFHEGMPESVGLGVATLFDRVYQTGEPYYARALEGWFDFGGTGTPEQLFFDLSLHPLRNARGEVDGVLDFSYDVSEQVLAGRQLHRLNQELEARVQQRTEELAAINEELTATNEELHDANALLTRTNADLDTFMYMASHDLKAPIANIEGLLQALHAELPVAVLEEDPVAHLLNLMQASVARFQQTIGHLTHISQLQRPEAAEPVALPALVEGVRLDLGPLIEAAGATVVVDTDGCAAVRVAPKTMRSVVYNLLSNALKYRASDRSAHVTLRARCVPGLFVLAVADNGLGLTEAQQGQLFGMFKRLHTHVEGAGVGLFTVKRLVENAGGTIGVQSQPGVGTTFTVSLPN